MRPLVLLPALLAVALGVAIGVAGTSGAATGMHSTKLAPKLCETTGGGRFVAIPGFPGERIDRRLLADIRWLEKRFSIFVTDGYSRNDVHAANGEHPIGLALDIVPNRAAGGRWSDIDRLARWAEPRRDHPRQPFRWVGYDGDAGHGRGNHLHLSWAHSVTTKGPRRPARTVYTIRCPRSAAPAPPAPPAPSEPAPPTEPAPAPDPPIGGVEPAGRGGSGDGSRKGGGRKGAGRNGSSRNGGSRKGGSRSGGVGARPTLAPAVIESGGVRARG